jgi:putative FmdB family regulatory protein
MPTYEYACAGCGRFEVWRDHRDAGAPLSCPGCGAEARRLFAAPAVRPPWDPFGSAPRDVRARVERSQSGEPVKTYGEDLPGRRIASHGHSHHRAHHHHGRGGHQPPPRPWQVGH